MLAVIVVRGGALPAGAREAVSECDGRALLAGSDAAAAVDELDHIAADVITAELGDFRPAAWAATLGELLADEPIVVLPASPDGRDLAPRLAALLHRPLYAQALAVSPSKVELIRRNGTELHSIEPPDAFVATLQPGVRGVEMTDRSRRVHAVVAPAADPAGDPTIEDVLPPDAATIDLSEADRIVAGGAGLDDRRRFDQLATLGAVLRASVGATRVITDRGWVGHQRQIGTTGVTVDPDLYIAFGISGAVQHTSGLGRPQHIVSINTDAFCPMTQLADVAVVADANAVLDALVEQMAPDGG